MKFFLLLFFASFTFADISDRCGTINFFNNTKNAGIKENGEIKLLSKVGCIPENYYGQVLNLTTKHFAIFYTLEGAHAVKSVAFIDSLALYLENAYKLHKDSLGMESILGATVTFHYRQKVPVGLYPVEVVDTGLLRNSEGDYSKTFGLTFAPNSGSPFATQIAIENDFLYGATCSNPKSTHPFNSNTNGDYSVKWNLALKVTTVHELYHSFQLRKINLKENQSFWLESSAAGVEDIGAPEVNDYIDYLSIVFRKPGLSMEDAYSRDDQSVYAYSTLYLYLFSQLGAKFDSAIFSYFAKYKNENFSIQLARLVDSLGLDAEDFFHNYAKTVFYSNNRAAFSPTPLFWEDQPIWPNWAIHSEKTMPSVLPAGVIDFVRTDGNPPSVDSVARISHLVFGDSSVWVLSRLLAKKFIPITLPEKFVAFPNPWHPHKNAELRFSLLPEKATGIEIRTANGALLHRINGEVGTATVWQPKKIPAPGILYYRTLPYGKPQKLIVEF